MDGEEVVVVVVVVVVVRGIRKVTSCQGVRSEVELYCCYPLSFLLCFWFSIPFPMCHNTTPIPQLLLVHNNVTLISCTWYVMMMYPNQQIHIITPLLCSPTSQPLS